MSGFGNERTVTDAKIDTDEGEPECQRSGTYRGSVTVCSGGAGSSSSSNCFSFAGQANILCVVLQSPGFSVPLVVLQQLRERQAPTQPVPAKSVPTPIHVRQEPRCLITPPAGRSQSTLRGFFMGENAPNRGRTQDKAIFGRKEESKPFPSTFPVGFSRRERPEGSVVIVPSPDISCTLPSVVAPVSPSLVPLSGFFFGISVQNCFSRVHGCWAIVGWCQGIFMITKRVLCWCLILQVSRCIDLPSTRMSLLLMLRQSLILTVFTFLLVVLIWGINQLHGVSLCWRKQNVNSFSWTTLALCARCWNSCRRSPTQFFQW